MTLRRGGDGFWIAALQTCIQVALLAGCANTQSAGVGVEAPRSSEPCEYRNVFVEFDDPVQLYDPRVEPLRRAVLSRAEEAFPELGWVAVADPSDAYWRMFANAWVDRQGNPLVHLGMSGVLKLGRHLFVVAMADESFPFRGGTGGSYNFVKASLADTKLLASQVEVGMRWIWELDSEQITALCEVRSALIDEGWVAVEELRQELIVEMEQIRRARARATELKKLELEVEATGQLEHAE